MGNRIYRLKGCLLDTYTSCYSSYSNTAEADKRKADSVGEAL